MSQKLKHYVVYDVCAQRFLKLSSVWSKNEIIDIGYVILFKYRRKQKAIDKAHLLNKELEIYKNKIKCK